eukprot:g20147.t1
MAIRLELTKNHPRWADVWIVANATEALGRMREADYQEFFSYDFARLYTALLHTDLIEKIDRIIDEAFRGPGKKADAAPKYKQAQLQKFRDSVSGKLTTYGVFSSEDLSPQERTAGDYYTPAKIKLLLRWVVTKNYIEIGGLLLRQLIGLPMGCPAAPELANLFLCYYEIHFCECPAGQHLRGAGVCRYIDDLVAPARLSNDEGVLEMYPKYLRVTEENKDETLTTTFLDEELDTGCGRLIFCLFDKTRTFPVYIPKYTPAGSCVSEATIYGTFVSVAIRAYDKNSLALYFLRDLVELIARFVINGTMKKKYIKKMAVVIKERHWEAKWFTKEKFIKIMAKFGSDILQLLEELQTEGN